MIKPVPLLASALLFAACGRPAAVPSVAPSQLAPADAFQCAMKTLQSLGYKRAMFDQDELRTSASKENPKITFSSTQFRKTWDRLDVDVQTGNTGTEMEVVAVTEAEYFSQNGKNFERLKASPEVQQAARQLQSGCAAVEPIAGDSVPSARQ